MVNNIFNSQLLIYAFTMLIYVSIMTYGIYMDIRRSHDFVQAINPIFLLDSIVVVLKILLTSYDCEYAMSQVKNMFPDPFQLYCVRSIIRIGESL